MIVFFGRLDDRPLALAIERAAAGDVPYLVVDQTRLHEDEFVLDVGADRVDGRLRACGTELELGAISAVYAARSMPPTTRDDLARSRAEQFNGAFLEWLDDARLPGRQPPARDAVQRVQALPAAAGRRDRHGGAGDVGHEPARGRARVPRPARPAVYKSISGIRSIVTELERARSSGSTASGRCPPSSRPTSRGSTSACTWWAIRLRHRDRERRDRLPVRAPKRPGRDPDRHRAAARGAAALRRPRAAPGAPVLRHRPAPQAGWRPRLLRGQPHAGVRLLRGRDRPAHRRRARGAARDGGR